MTTLIISNEEMDDIMKITKFLEESGLMIKDVSETIKTEAKEQRGELFGMLLGSLEVTFLGNLLTGKLLKAKILRRGVMRAGEGTIRAGEGTIKAD